jgi:hypothetical protein
MPNFQTRAKIIRGGADKSLARPTSRSRRTESSVVGKRGPSCAELQVPSCYRGRNEACQATRTISLTLRREFSSSYFPARKGAERRYELYNFVSNAAYKETDVAYVLFVRFVCLIKANIQ